MPLYEVTGADRATGDEKTTRCHAADRDAAIKQVSAYMLIASIEQLPEITRITPLPRVPSTPGYHFMLAMASVMIALGVIVILSAVFQFISASQGRSSSVAGEYYPIIGVVLAGLGEGLRALRDIAMKVARISEMEDERARRS